MTIRDATKADLGALMSLNAEVQGIHVALFPTVFRDTDAEALRNWFERQMEDQAVSVLVALDGDRVIGYLTMRMSARDPHVFCHARRCAYIDQVCVTAELRNRGIAAALLEEARRRAKQGGMAKLELDVWSENKEAKAAFRSLGFRTYNEKMALEI